MAVLKTSSWRLHEMSPVFAAHGVTATRFDALHALYRHGGAARAAELRDTLHLPAQRYGGAASRDFPAAPGAGPAAPPGGPPFHRLAPGP